MGKRNHSTRLLGSSFAVILPLLISNLYMVQGHVKLKAIFALERTPFENDLCYSTLLLISHPCNVFLDAKLPLEFPKSEKDTAGAVGLSK